MCVKYKTYFSKTRNLNLWHVYSAVLSQEKESSKNPKITLMRQLLNIFPKSNPRAIKTDPGCTSFSLKELYKGHSLLSRVGGGGSRESQRILGGTHGFQGEHRGE